MYTGVCFSDPSQTDSFLTGIHQATTSDMLLPTASVHLWCSNTTVRGSRREARIVESIPGRRGMSDINFYTYKSVTNSLSSLVVL